MKIILVLMLFSTFAFANEPATLTPSEISELAGACGKKPRIQITGIITKIQTFPTPTNTPCFKNATAAITVQSESAGIKTLFKGTLDEETVLQSHCGSEMKLSDVRVGDITYMSLKPLDNAVAKGRAQVIRVTPIVAIGEKPK